MDKSGITIINNDGNIVLNDTFVNMELLRIVPCKSMTGDSTVALREMFRDNELLAFVWNNSGGNMVAAITTNNSKRNPNGGVRFVCWSNEYDRRRGDI